MERTHKHAHPNTQAEIGGVKDKTRTQTHAPRTPARIGGVEVERAHKNTHPSTLARNGRAQLKLEPKQTHTHAAHPSQDWRGTSGKRTETHTPQPPGQDWRVEAKTQTHTTHSSNNWRGAAETRARTHAPHSPARNGGVRAERAHKHTQPITPATIGGVQAKPKPKHTHHKPQPGLAGRDQNPYQNTQTLDRIQEWRGYRETRTQTQAPHNSRKPSVHSPGTEAARAMQVTRPSEMRRPGVRLHPKGCAALGLEAKRATPKHLRTQVPRTRRWYALGTGYAKKSGELLGFRPNEGTCASTGAHPPGVTDASSRRRLTLPVLPGAGLLEATSQV